MRWIASRKTCPCIACCPCRATLTGPPRRSFSADGTTAFVLNCGPECGGNQASVSFLPVAGIIIQSGAPVPPGAPTAVTATVPVPGGDHRRHRRMEISCTSPDSSCNPMAIFAGFLSILDTNAKQVTGAYSISDGTHLKMLFADDNTLWIGSQLCTQGERYHQGATTDLGCLTMFNTSTNSVTMIDSYKGDATGIAAVTSLHKVYTAEGGQVYIYNTANGASIDNSQVTVVGTAYDVAYMDAPSDDDNTTY